MQLVNYLLEYHRFLNIIGIFVIIGIAYLFSHKRVAISWRLSIMALAMQFGLGFLVLRTRVGFLILQKIADIVQKLYEFSDAGATFVFGNLTDATSSWGFIFAIKVLPIIIFFGALTSLLFYVRLIPYLVMMISKVIQPLLGTSGAETLCAISNSFLGQTEAPLLIRNYLADMTNSEIFVVMVSGMATISGAILVVFAAMGVPTIHMLAASVMAIPASILIAKIMIPEEETPSTHGSCKIVMKSESHNILEAISVGTTDGLYLALNVGAMIISFLAILAGINYLLELISHMSNQLFLYLGVSIRIPLLNIPIIFSYLFAPFGFLLGFQGDEIFQAGSLLGTKMAVNELIAYGQMVQMKLSPRMVNILTYALCGFSNFSCIGIQIGGIGALVPQKRRVLTGLGIYAVIAAMLANILSAMIAALLL